MMQIENMCRLKMVQISIIADPVHTPRKFYVPTCEDKIKFHRNEPVLLLIRYVSHGYQMPREQSLGRLSESDRRPNDCSLGI